MRLLLLSKTWLYIAWQVGDICDQHNVKSNGGGKAKRVYSLLHEHSSMTCATYNYIDHLDIRTQALTARESVWTCMRRTSQTGHSDRTCMALLMGLSFKPVWPKSLVWEYLRFVGGRLCHKGLGGCKNRRHVASTRSSSNTSFIFQHVIQLLCSVCCVVLVFVQQPHLLSTFSSL